MRKIFVREYRGRFYVADSGRDILDEATWYLHHDGTWERSTMVKGVESGYFASRSDAVNALARVILEPDALLALQGDLRTEVEAAWAAMNRSE